MSSFESLSLDQRWAIITKDSFLSIRKLVSTILLYPPLMLVVREYSAYLKFNGAMSETG